MSTQTVSTLPIAANAMKAPKAKKIVPVKKRPLQCHRKPGMQAEAALRSCTWQLIEDGYSYDEAQELLRLYLIGAAMKCAKDVKTKAAARLKITREHLDNYLARGKGLL